MKRILILIFCVSLTIGLTAQTNNYYIDFGLNDVTNGNETTSPDANGNYWNNMSNSTAGQFITLVDKNNVASTIQPTLVVTFGANGIQNGGLLNPDPALLNDFAVATATQDYFFLSTSPTADEIEFSGLDPTKGYVFNFFGTRNTTSTRITTYDLAGQNSFTGNLQTSGTNLGGNGYNGNNSTIIVSDTILPDANGKIIFNMSINTGGFAYLGAMRLDEIDLSSVNLAPIVDAGSNAQLPSGTTTHTLAGTATDPENDPLTYTWTQVSGPSTTIVNPNMLSTTVNGLIDGEVYIFELNVSDGTNNVSDLVTISVGSLLRSFYVDFGPNDVTNGNSTTSPDANGNYWNNMTTASGGIPVTLVDNNNLSTNIQIKVINPFTANGIQNGGLLNPNPALLNEYAVATATQDYFFTVSSGTLRIDGLDPTKAYVFNTFGSRNTPTFRETKYVFSGTTHDSTTLQTSGANLGGTGYDGNNSSVATSAPVRPDATGRLTIDIAATQGTFAYLNLMRIDEVEVVNPTFLVDFGPDDATNGNATASPDINGNYWNNLTQAAANQDTVNLVSNTNTMSSAYLTVTQGFLTNGINHGGLLNPEDTLLGHFAIATATQDYFFTSGTTGSLEIGGLDTSKSYVFQFFGTRNTGSDRITNYALNGANTFSGDLQTSGTDLGGTGYNGNNSSVITTDTMHADSNGIITIDVSVTQGGFAYIGLMQMEEITPLLQPAPLCPTRDSLLIAVMGSSVADGYGATNSEGYAFQYTQLLNDRFANGDGEDWSVTNISVGGNNTILLGNRWEDDLLPLCSRYVIYGLSLGNEGIMSQGQAAFNQFETNMLQLITQARNAGIEPIVVNCYANGSFDSTDYNFTKQMNLLIHNWDVASINTLGAVDDGTGKWAAGYVADPAHPNTAGHTEMVYTIVPSLFDAMKAGKPQPNMVTNTYLTIDKSINDVQLEFTPDAVVHPFTVSFDVKTTETGTVGGFTTDNGGYGGLTIDNSGNLDYVTDGTNIIEGSSLVNDGNWHKITLTHYYAWGKTLLYVDGVLQGDVDENLEVNTFILSEANGASADFREWYFYRSGMTQEEITAMVNGDLLKSSLELYAPLDGQAVVGNEPLVNLAQSLGVVTEVNGYQYITSTNKIDFQNKIKFKVFPNPSVGDTNISFELKDRSEVQLSIYDINGREVNTIINESLPSGEYHIPWNKNNTIGNLFLCVLRVNNQVATTRMIVLD